MQFLRRKLDKLNSADGDTVSRPQPKRYGHTVSNRILRIASELHQFGASRSITDIPQSAF